MNKLLPRLAALLTTERPLIEARHCITDVLSRAVPPDVLVAYLTDRKDFRDDLIRDLLGDSLLLRCARTAKSSAEAHTFALRLAFAGEVDLFACIGPQHVYRSTYFEALRQIAATENDVMSSTPICWNLIDQQWLPRDQQNPVPYHFRGGLGLSDEERSLGQQLGAPDTFVLNRAAASILLMEAWKHPHYQTAAYDQVWRQTLLSHGVNISLRKTSESVFIFVERGGRAESEHAGMPSSTQIDSQAQETGPKFPEGLRDPSAVKQTRLKAAGNNALAEMTIPTVSIVIPTYNEGDWLFHTVDSLHSMATSHSFEIVVVDDGCDDGSTEKLCVFPDVRLVQTPHKQAGLITAKNTGAAEARGRYLCFVDSHMLMPDGWLDSLMNTIRASKQPTLVTCGITDVMHYGKDTPLIYDQYGYTLADWTFNVRWHHYGRSKFVAPFSVPLCPGGLSLMERERFEHLGGFCSVLRKWGSEDVEFALRHYCAGGQTLSDPGTHVYHYFKNNKTRKPTFSITFAQTAFNALFVAWTYFSPRDFQLVKEAFLKKAKLQAIVEEIESGTYSEQAESIRALFSRGFDDWRLEFSREVSPFEAAIPAAPKKSQTVTGA